MNNKRKMKKKKTKNKVYVLVVNCKQYAHLRNISCKEGQNSFCQVSKGWGGEGGGGVGGERGGGAGGRNDPSIVCTYE
jgi:hypothetical protein